MSNDLEPTNEMRADRAMRTLIAYVGSETRVRHLASTDCFEEVMIDVLCDLRHLCARRGVSYMDLDGMADSHYDEEVELEGPCALRG